MRRTLLLASLALLAAIAAMSASCARNLTWDPSAGAWSETELRTLLEQTDTSRYADLPAAQSVQRRNEVLTELRGKGSTGATVADLLTESFPQATAGVPVYIAVGSFSGEPAVAVVEAYGAKGQPLNRKRLWVLSLRGNVLYAAAAK